MFFAVQKHDEYALAEKVNKTVQLKLTLKPIYYAKHNKLLSKKKNIYKIYSIYDI